ncbi:MAG: 6-hydroxymethylpterin diphosphokinase MptE-like protein [Thermodesulfobacteriota bacterium]
MTAPARPDPAIYEANRRALARHRPELLARLEALLPADRTEVVLQPTASGSWTAVARNSADGRTVTLHSTEDPEAEACQLVDEAGCKPGELRCLMGLGLGYMAREIRKRQVALLTLLVIEASAQVFAAALEAVDLTTLLADADATLILGETESFEPILRRHESAISAQGLAVTTYEPERQLFPSFCQRELRRLAEEANSLAGLTTSQKNLGRRIFSNIMANCTTVLQSANLACLAGTMQGRPAVVLGAGPGLAAGIEVLRQFPDRAFLVAVDSALPILAREGLSPHLVVTVDCTEECFEKFRSGLDQTARAPLCYVNGVIPTVAKLYRHPTRFFLAQSTSFLHDLQHLWGGWAEVPARFQGVAHLAFEVAVISGASSIILLGFDLAYTGFRSHADGMAMPVTINLAKAPWVEGMDGAMLPSMQQFIGTRTDLEALIRTCPAPCYNANRAGARIAGAPPIDLAAFLAAQPTPAAAPGALIAQAYAQAGRPSRSDLGRLVASRLHHLRQASLRNRQAAKAVSLAWQALARQPGGHRLPPARKAVAKALTAYEQAYKALTQAQFEDMAYLVMGEMRALQAEEHCFKATAASLPEGQKVRTELSLVRRSLSVQFEALDQATAALARLQARLAAEERLQRLAEDAASPQERAAVLTEAAQAFLDYGDLGQAEQALQEATLLAGSTDLRQVLLARCLHSQGRLAEARQILATVPSGQDLPALTAFRQEEARWLGLRLAAIRKHIDLDSTFVNLPLAIAYCQDVLTWMPEHAEAQSLLDEAQAKSHRYQAENARLASMLSLNEEEALAQVEALLATEDAALAGRLLGILTRKYPASGRIRERLALLRLEEGQPAEAEQLLAQAISLAPERPEGRVHLAALLAERGELAEARGYLNQALALDPDGLVALNEGAGDLAAELGCYQEAIAAYERFFLAFPQRRDILRRLGYCYQQLGQTAAAQAAWQAAAT